MAKYTVGDEITYYTWITWTHNGHRYKMLTQLYDICGVYVVINSGAPDMSQWGSSPQHLRQGQLKQIKQFKEDGIEYYLGPTITVKENEKGNWIAVGEEIGPLTEDEEEANYEDDEEDD